MNNIKQHLFLLFILSIQLVMAQEVNNKNIEGQWKLNWVKGGFFPNNNLIFEKSETNEGQYIFNFEKGGIVSQKLGTAGMGECPVGFFRLDKGKWHLQEGYLTLELKGNKIADYAYDYKIVYVPKLENGSLRLSVSKVIKSKQTK